MSKMSKTAALREAQIIVGRPIRESATSYVVMTPAYPNKPYGPTRELRADSYPKIVTKRAVRVAETALTLMGEDEATVDEVQYLLHCKGPMSAKSLVEAAISAK